LIEPQRDADMINTFLAHFDQSPKHMLPVWPLQANETFDMIGYHAVAVIADGYLKGIKGFDPLRAYDACKTTAENQWYSGLTNFTALGWVAYNKYGESVSKTLEYAYDDYCIAQLAKALGKREDCAHFMQLAANYKNVFDPSTSVMRPRDSQGNWRTPFDPHQRVAAYLSGKDAAYTEATAWQYSWYVPQDVPSLIALMGGNDRFTEKLDAFFSIHDDPKRIPSRGWIGEYEHGNEPGHQTIYLYCYAGQPWKAAERLHQVLKTQYGNKPFSLPGNDDCGQMSAWYVLTALGFYPVCPASDYYVLGSPAVPKATLQLANGKTFAITADGISDKNIYVQSVRLNGKDWNNPFLPYAELKNGGTLAFVMGPEPSRWGTQSVVPE
jgi:predicted alpha-1,2-mannosidase